MLPARQRRERPDRVATTRQDTREAVRAGKTLKLRPTRIRDFKMLQLSNSSRVMEAGDHFKNGVSMKNHKSSGHILIIC